MRKRNIKKLADTIFWYVVYLLPILLTVIQSIGIFGNFTFADWQNIDAFDAFFDLLSSNLSALGVRGNTGIVASALIRLFGSSGILPSFSSPALLYFSQWFVGCMLVHLCVDFILFIPRIAHKWMDTLTKED